MNTDENMKILKKIEKHLETLVRLNYSEIKKQAFANETERKVFELTSLKGRDEICKELHISSATLAELWGKWFDMGLLVKNGKSYQKAIE